MVILSSKKAEGVLLMDKEYYTVKEAAAYSTLAEVTVRLYIRQGKLKAVNVGRRVIISRKELELLLGGQDAKTP